MPSAAASHRSALSRIIGTLLKARRRGAAARAALRSRSLCAAVGPSVASAAACAERSAIKVAASSPAPSSLSAPRRALLHCMICLPWFQVLLGDRDRNEMVDHHQNDQEHETDPEAPGDQLLLDRQQRLDRSVQELLADIRLRHRGYPF